MIFVASGLYGSIMLAPTHVPQRLEIRLPRINTESYSREMAGSTASFAGIDIASATEISSTRFRLGIATFYDQLLNKQEPLGASFSAVLEENLWDLYVRA